MFSLVARLEDELAACKDELKTVLEERDRTFSRYKCLLEQSRRNLNDKVNECDEYKVRGQIRPTHGHWSRINSLIPVLLSSAPTFKSASTVVFWFEPIPFYTFLVMSDRSQR